MNYIRRSLAECREVQGFGTNQRTALQAQSFNPSKEMYAAKLVLFFYEKEFSLCHAYYISIQVLRHRLCKSRAVSIISAS